MTPSSEIINRTGRALFLDRDGTLIEHIPYLSCPDEVRILPGVREALLKAIEARFDLYLHTNQSGIGRGYFSLADAEACNRRVLELLALPVDFKEIKIAPEGPETAGGYRKPSPRFIEECVARDHLIKKFCFMIGDNQSDTDAGIHAGVTPLAILDGAGAKENPNWPHYLQTNRIAAFATLPEAVEHARMSCDDGF